MAGACVRVLLPVVSVKPRPFVEQPVEAAGEVRPELVDLDEIRDDPDRTEGRVFSYTVGRTSVDGLTGTPSLATAAEGERLFEEVAGALAASFNAARVERPPDLSRSIDGPSRGD